MEWSLQNDTLARVGVMAPGRTRRPSMFVRLASPVAARLLTQRTTMQPLALLTGRNTGRPHTTPVAVSESDGRHWLAAIFSEVNWTRNLRATGAAILTQGRSRTAVLAVQLAPEASAEVLEDAVAPDASSRLAARFIRRYADVRPDAALTEFVAAARQHPVFGLRESSRVGSPTAATPSTTGGTDELHVHAYR